MAAGTEKLAGALARQALLLLALFAVVQRDAAAQVHVTPGFEVVLAAGGASLKASGSWATRLNRGASLSISAVNAVEISCSRADMTCAETRAQLAPGARATADGSKEQLVLSTLSFAVTEWTESRITARSDTREGDLMLRIVPSEKLVRLSYWDTKGSRDKDGRASGFVWELQ